MIAFGFGFLVPLSETICCYAIVMIVLLDLFVELNLMKKLGIESPTLRNKNIIDQDQNSTIFDSLKIILESWLLFFKSNMNIPGIALGALYLNALALSPMLEGYARQSCVSESSISVLFIVSAGFGMFAPITYSRLVNRFGLMTTGNIAGLWHITTLMLAVIALFLPGSEYLSKNESSSLKNITVGHHEASFWLHCPKNQETSFPESYLSLGLIFISIVLQRWAILSFDLTVNQLFQENIPDKKRNRIAAGQFGFNSLMDIILMSFGMIWSDRASFGNAILLSTLLILAAYLSYYVWCKKIGRQLQKQDGEVKKSLKF